LFRACLSCIEAVKGRGPAPFPLPPPLPLPPREGVVFRGVACRWAVDAVATTADAAAAAAAAAAPVPVAVAEDGVELECVLELGVTDPEDMTDDRSWSGRVQASRPIS